MLHTLLLSVMLWQTPAESQNKQAIEFLRTLQTESGGFPVVKAPNGTKSVPSLRATRTALRGFRLLGGTPANPEAVRTFLLACHDSQTGGFADRPGLPPDPISTSVALMIMGELKVPIEHYLEPGLKFMGETTKDFEQIRMVAPGLEHTGKRVPQADDWLKIIDKARNPDGSYGTGPHRARMTGLYVVAQQRLGSKPESIDAVLKVLREGQQEDGGFIGKEGVTDLEACYRIVRLFSRLNTQPPDVAKLRSFIARCRNPDGGYGVRPGQPSSLHGTYYAAIVRHWLDGGK